MNHLKIGTQLCMTVVLASLCLLLGCECVAAKDWKQESIIITSWCPPNGDDASLSAYAKDNYNLIILPESNLDIAHKYGLKVCLWAQDILTPQALSTPEKKAALDALIERVKNHPAMDSYLVSDEPGIKIFGELAQVVAYIRKRDPAHLPYVNLFPTYATQEQLNISADEVRKISTEGDKVFLTNARDKGSEETAFAYKGYLQHFIETVKPQLISYDHYNFFKSVDGAQYFLNLELIREAAVKAKLPFMNIIQASTFIPDWRLVTTSELRWLVYTTLAYGGRGISYFVHTGAAGTGALYEDGKRTPLADDAAAANTMMKVLSPTLMSLDSTGVYHTSPLPYGTQAIPAKSPVQIVGDGEYVLGLFSRKGHFSAFMIVNRNYKKKAQAHLKLADGYDKLQEIDQKTGLWQAGPKADPNNKTFAVDLGPGEGRLLRVIK